MTDSDTLGDSAIAFLSAAGTAAGERVFSWRTWPTAGGILPALLVYTEGESGQSIGPHGPPTFTSTITLKVVGQAEGATEVAASALALAMAQQVRNCLLRNQAFRHSNGVQEFTGYHYSANATAEGKRFVGQMTFALEAQVFQVFEPEYDAAGTPIAPDLTGVDVHLDAVNVYDPTGSYPGAVFPAAVQPAPRDNGPDGRDEAGARIDLPT